MNSSAFELALNFYYAEEFEIFLPQLFILKSENDQNFYFHKIATEEVLMDFPQFNVLFQEHIKLVNSIQINALSVRFLKRDRPKKINDLTDFLNTPANKKLILDYIARQKAKVFELLTTHPIKLTFRFDKNSPFNKHQIQLSKDLVQPLPNFEKTLNGILYTLQLKVNNQIFFPIDANIVPLLDTPGWVLIGQTIYKLNHLNANKLKPFLTQKTIDIPERLVKTYFEKFIKDVVKKVDITAKGFDIQTQTHLTSVLLTPYYHFFQKRYVIQIQFGYNDILFDAFDNRRKHVSLSIIEQDKVIIYETKRNTNEESFYQQKLSQFGLTLLETGLYTFQHTSGSQNLFQDVEELLSKKDIFIENGYTIADFEIDNHLIVAEKFTLQTDIKESQDWFDINVQIRVGNYTFPFVSLIANIHQENPFFQLPNGNYFLIPKEWFSKFKTFLNYTTENQSILQLPRNRYPLLQIFAKNDLPNTVDTAADADVQVPSTVKALLRTYQVEGYRWLWQHHQKNTGACLADDMGLGKTLQCITLLEQVKQSANDPITAFPTDLFSDATLEKPPLQSLIICPSSLVYNWIDEIQKFVPHWKIINYTGTHRNTYKNKLKHTDVVITTYQTLLRDIEFFVSQSFNYIIADESQLVKNRDSKLFKAIGSIQTNHRIALSGTPIENSLSDLWSMMQFINPELLGSYPIFEKHFKIPIEKEHDDLVLQDLKNLIKPFLLRRTKHQVLKDLPELTEQIIKTEMTPQQHRLYVSEKSKARNLLLRIKGEKKANTGVVFKTLMRLRQISNHPALIGNITSSGKFEEVTAYLLTLQHAGIKTLVFSFFSEHLKLYTDWCNTQQMPYSHFDGSINAKKRQSEINKFNTDSQINLFFITTGSGGVGLNLTAATTVLILDPWWNPFKELQAISRSHRMGQTLPVHVVRFIAKESIEEKILNLQERKMLLSQEMLSFETIPNSILNDLDYVLE